MGLFEPVISSLSVWLEQERFTYLDGWRLSVVPSHHVQKNLLANTFMHYCVWNRINQYHYWPRMNWVRFGSIHYHLKSVSRHGMKIPDFYNTTMESSQIIFIMLFHHLIIILVLRNVEKVFVTFVSRSPSQRRFYCKALDWFILIPTEIKPVYLSKFNVVVGIDWLSSWQKNHFSSLQ